MKTGLRRFLGKAASAAAALAMVVASVPAGVDSGLFGGSVVKADAADTSITTWSALYDAVKAGGTVKLGADIKAESYLLVNTGVTTVLDLNGHTLDRGLTAVNSTSGYIIKNKGTMTIKDSGSTGTIKGAYYSNYGGILNQGNLTIAGGTITGNNANYTVRSYGGAIFNNGTLTVSGGTITGNRAQFGGAIANDEDGIVYIKGGTISGNNALTGAGIWNNGTLYLSGGTIIGNVAAGDSSGNLCGGLDCVNDKSKTFISGNPVVQGNTGKGINADVSCPRKLFLSDKLTSGAKIGIYGSSAFTITSGWSSKMSTSASPSTYFFSNKSNFTIGLSSGEAVFKSGETPVVNYYTVTYSPNGGTGTMSQVSVPSGNSLTLAPCSFTAPQGKVFDKWQIGANYYAAGTAVTITKDTTVYATWKTASTKCSIFFEANGGTGTMNTVQVEKNSSYQLPACTFTPPANKEFDKWNYGSAGSYITVTNNLTLKPVWKNKTTTYAVTFNANGGSGTMQTVQVAAGSSYQLPACTFTAPANKEFDKWNYGKSGNYITVNGPVELKAIWKDKAAATYTVSFNANGGTGTMNSVQVTAGSSYQLPACTFTAPANKEFDKWNYGKSGNYITVNGPVELKAIWKDKAAATYTVSFNANGGTGTMNSVQVTAGSSYQLPACTFGAPTGKVFDKWNYGNAGSYITVNSNISLVAQWKWIDYTVSWDTNGGWGGTTSTTYHYGDTFTLSNCVWTPPQEGMEFDAWQIGSKTYQPGAVITVTSNLVVKALWKSTSSSPVLKGDVDGNGKVNMQDYALLQKHLMNNTISINRDNADMDGDGKITMRDYSLLQKKLLKGK
ncbi:MAG: InlB B-repeat-containing protein [Ruminococcus sp.]|nr:InlB B-repeat-containing protein [Ruminococcus sp.]